MEPSIDRPKELENALIIALNQMGDISVLNAIIETGIINEGILECGVEMFASYSTISENKFIEFQKEKDNVKDTPESKTQEILEMLGILANIRDNPMEAINRIKEREIEKKRKSQKLVLTIKETVELVLLVGTTKLNDYLENRKNDLKPICGREIKEYELYYHCKTCDTLVSNSLISVLCNDCFIPEIHLNHDFEFRMQGNPGGCCDCGDITCLDPSCFCVRHRSRSSIINKFKPSNYTEQAVKPLLQIVMSEYNKLLVNVADTNEYNDKIAIIFQKLKFLYDIDNTSWIEIFLDTFLNCPKNVQTIHCCDPYNINFITNQEIKNHVCTCSIFDNLIRSLPHISKENHFVTMFLSEACKSFQIFRYEFIKSYFKVYRDLVPKYILRNEQGREFILKILYQSTWDEKPVTEYFFKHYQAYWIPTLDQIRDIVSTTPGEPSTIMLMYIYSEEFRHILTNNLDLCLTIFKDPLFLNSYLSAANQFTFFDNITQNIKLSGSEKDIIDHYKLIIFYYFSKIFDMAFQKYNLDDKEFNLKVFDILYSNVKKKINLSLPNIHDYNTFNLVIFRIFASFLFKFFNKLISRKDQLTPSNFIDELRVLLKVELNLNTNELEQLAKGICLIILKEFQFLTELETKCCIMNSASVKSTVEFYFSHGEELNYESDLSLFQFFVLFIDDTEIISLFKFFRGTDNYINLLTKGNSNLKSLYLEAITFRWMCLMRDDVSAMHIFFKTKYENCPDKIAPEDLPNFEYLFRKYATINAMKNDKNFDCFSEEIIKENFPSALRINSNQTKIKDFFKSIVVGKKVSLMCDDSSIQYLNLFNYNLVKDILMATNNTNIMINKKQLTPFNIYLTNVSIPPIFDSFYRSLRMKLTNQTVNDLLSECLINLNLNLNKQENPIINPTDFTQELITAHFSLFFDKIKIIGINNIQNTKEFNKPFQNQNEIALENFKYLKYIKIKFPSINQALIQIGKKEVKSPFMKILLEEMDMNIENNQKETNLKNENKNNNNNNLQMNQKSKQCLMKEKILQQMKMQREKFKKNNAPFLEESKDSNQKQDQNLCVVCKEPLKNNENEEDAYGELCKFSDSNIMKYIMRFSIKLLSNEINDLENELIDDDSFKELNTHSIYLHSCGHLIHVKCFKTTVDTKKMCLCPLCGYYNNIVLPRIHNPRENNYCTIFIIQLIFEFIKFSEFNKNLGNLKEDLDSTLVKSFLSSCYSMITNEEILGLRPSSLKIVSTLQNFLYNIISFGKKEERKESLLKSSLSILSSQETSWNSNAVLNTLSHLLHEFLFNFLNNENLEYLELSQKLDQIIINSLEDLIQRMLLLSYCKIKKTRLLNFQEFQNFPFKEDLINSKIFSETNRYLKKVLLMKYILITSLGCPQSLMTNYNDLIVNAYNLETQVLFKQLCKLINLNEGILNQIFQNAINGIHLLQSNNQLLIHKFSNLNLNEIKNIKTNERINQTEFRIEASFFLNSFNMNFQILELPLTFDKLVFKYAFLNCRKCHQNCKNKCVCLICGDILCGNAKCCKAEKNQGELNIHSKEVHDGFSYFVNVYFAEIIAISPNLGTYIKNLYINESEENVNAKFEKQFHIISRDSSSYNINTQVIETLKENILRSGILRNILKIVLKEEGIKVSESF